MENLEIHISELLSSKDIKQGFLKVSKNSAFSSWKPQNNLNNLKLHITFVNGIIKLV